MYYVLHGILYYLDTFGRDVTVLLLRNRRKAYLGHGPPDSVYSDSVRHTYYIAHFYERRCVSVACRCEEMYFMRWTRVVIHREERFVEHNAPFVSVKHFPNGEWKKKTKPVDRQPFKFLASPKRGGVICVIIIYYYTYKSRNIFSPFVTYEVMSCIMLCLSSNKIFEA